jgi:hypothetical protein
MLDCLNAGMGKWFSVFGSRGLQSTNWFVVGWLSGESPQRRRVHREGREECSIARLLEWGGTECWIA